VQQGTYQSTDDVHQELKASLPGKDEFAHVYALRKFPHHILESGTALLEKREELARKLECDG
jgi:hypothetical protein